MQPQASTFILTEHFCSHTGLETTRGRSPSRGGHRPQHRICSSNCWSWGANSHHHSSANPNSSHRFVSPHQQPSSSNPKTSSPEGWMAWSRRGRFAPDPHLTSLCSPAPSPLHPIRGRGCASSLLPQLERGCASHRSYLLLFNEESGCPGAGSPWKLGFFRHSMEDAGTERFVQEY